MYVARFELEIARRFANAGLRNTPDIHMLQTAAAIFARLDQWADAQLILARWSAGIDRPALERGWHDFVFMFDDLHAYGHTDLAVALLEELNRPAVWSDITTFVRTTGTWPRTVPPISPS